MTKLLMSKLQFPIFDGKETIPQFIKRTKEFELQLKKKKYDIILEFINALINPENKYTSLTEFYNVPKSKIISNKKIINQYSSKLAKKLNINILELTCINSDDDQKYNDDISIIIFLQRILNSIQYSLISKIIDNEIYYTIKSGPQNKSKNYLL